MQGVRGMKPALAGLLLLAALPAAAGEDDLTAAMHRGVWTGCVHEAGYAPYPVKLIPHDGFMAVSYPHLQCAGTHDPDGAPKGHDAIERILVDIDTRCATDLPVIYTLTGDSLRIDYQHGPSGTYALLRPSAPDATPPACSAGEAVS